VASGDRLEHQLIIWTRISRQHGEVSVAWAVAEDISFSKTASSGTAVTTMASDFTLKVDVTGLKASSQYYYQFVYNSVKSPIGITKTVTSEGRSQLNFAVVSCNNYSAGYYNAFARIAEKRELDAVISLRGLHL
jgi:alkaline phosphatase D